MSGLGGSEFLLLCVIGLLILGPERLPRVARQIGSWLGKARQMTRALQRQLEEEASLEKNLGIDPEELHPDALLTPREEDTYSPLHDEDANDEDAEDNGEALTVDDSGEREEKTA
ncbi:MAG: Sec-independent protein translocase subunit TatA/TatB [Woeseiaceae bacterium]